MELFTYNLYGLPDATIRAVVVLILPNNIWFRVRMVFKIFRALRRT
jgi:hypothetical protein